MNKCALFLLVCVSLLFSIGLVMVFNTTSAEILDRSLYDESTHQALLKQILYGCLGIVAGVMLYFWGYQNVLKCSPYLLLLSIFLLLLVFVPKIGQEINGARRWISFAGWSFQPSEFAKFLIPFYFIHWICRQKKMIHLPSFLKIIAILAIPLLLILMEPDNGTTAILLVTLGILMVLTRIRWVFWALPLFFLAAIGAIAAYNMPHVQSRIRVYLHPELDLKGKGHQPYQAKIAAGSGQIFGRGLGESLQKLNYLPEARSDYIAAIYAEEFGFVGIIFLIAMYMSMAFAGFFIAISASDREGFYLAATITFLITFQAFLNMGVVSGLLPSKGTTLPFFSQGGTSLISNVMGLALLLSIARVKEWKLQKF